uniref:Uncharacterized protein n=1 Tax=Anguilla anguilla TaxID=7936 RepID=A0A0E9PCY3_ANGAN
MLKSSLAVLSSNKYDKVLALWWDSHLFGLLQTCKHVVCLLSLSKEFPLGQTRMKFSPWMYTRNLAIRACAYPWVRTVCPNSSCVD